MFQIVFNDISAAEMAQMPKGLQLEILSEFDGLPGKLEKPDGEQFGIMERDGKKIYRYRAQEYRIYFEPSPDGIVIHRVLHKNSLKDFLYRTKLAAVEEDDILQNSPKFWEMIHEGKKN